MTAAGTVAPAKVLVLGAGVAGLQAIATARRLGAVVVGLRRAARRARSRSRASGATFLDLGVRGEESEGGYARELAGRRSSAPQQEALEERAARVRRRDHDRARARSAGAAADPRAPRCAAMRPGSVIVDLAAETGGNCELTEPGEEVVREGRHDRRADEPAEHDGAPREPALLAQRRPRCCSHLAPEGELTLDFEDEITAGACVTHGARRCAA